MLHGWNVSLSPYLVSFAHHRLIYFLPCLVTLNSRWLDKVSNIKIWLLPALFVCSFSVLAWLIRLRFNFQGFRWLWYAVFEWMLLFVICLYEYQKKTSNFKAFTMAFLSVYLGGFIYELPFKAWANQWNFHDYDAWLNYIIGFAMFGIMLYQLGFKPTPLILISVNLLVVGWAFCIPLILFKVWAPLIRLSVFPLFISISYTLKKENQK